MLNGDSKENSKKKKKSIGLFSSTLFFIHFRAANNSRSMDNVRSKIDFVRANP